MLTGAQVDLACAIVPNHHVERFAENLAETVEILAPLTAHQTGTVLRGAVKAADAFAEREAAEAGTEPVERVPERELSAVRSLDDEMFLKGNLDKDSAAVVEKALTAAARDDVDGERRTPMERRADALVAVCQGYLDSLESPDGNRRTERLTLTADVVALYRAWLRGAGVCTADDLDDFLSARPDLGELDRGLFLEAFDGTGSVPHHRRAIGHRRPAGGGGRRWRHGAPAHRRAPAAAHGPHRAPLHRRPAPGRPDPRRRLPVLRGPAREVRCPPRRAVGQTAATDVANVVAKCRRCHLEHHRKKWVDRLDSDGTYRVIRPDGTEIVTRPAGLDDRLPTLPVATTSAPARSPRCAPEGVKAAVVDERSLFHPDDARCRRADVPPSKDRHPILVVYAA